MKRGKTLWKTLVSASAVLTLAAGAFTPALAADSDTGTANTTGTFPDGALSKKYALETELDAGTAISPAETFAFTTANLSGLKDTGYSGINDGTIPTDIKTITIGSATFEAGKANASETDTASVVPITIQAADISKYQKPGTYYYDFTEKTGNTAGVTYSTDAYRVVLPVIAVDGDDTSGNKSLAFDMSNIHIVKGTTNSNGTYTFPTTDTGFQYKIDRIENTYTAGGLAIKKVVKGKAGDVNQTFTVTVKLTAPTNRKVKSQLKLSSTNAPADNVVYVDGHQLNADAAAAASRTYTISSDATGWDSKTIQFSVKNDTTFEIDNIPAGVTYTVSEVAGSYDAVFRTSDGTELASVSDGSGTIATKNAAVIDKTVQGIVIVNNKDINMDTGVFLNNMPYIVLVAAAGIALVFFMKNQKHQEQE